MDELSSFGDKELYNGGVPTGKYLAHVYKLFHASIRAHLDNEVKKRGAETLHWDVSYKETKNLCQYRGNSVYHGLVTTLNEFGEVRIQFHVFSDGHDQMVTALKVFEKTTTEYGMAGVQWFLTLTLSNACWEQRGAGVVPTLLMYSKVRLIMLTLLVYDKALLLPTLLLVYGKAVLLMPMIPVYGSGSCCP